MGFTITGNETLLFITTDASNFQFIGLFGSLVRKKKVAKCVYKMDYLALLW